MTEDVKFPGVYVRPEVGRKRRGESNGFHPQRWMVIAGTVGGIVATALPWVQLPMGASINGLYHAGRVGDGIFVLPLFAVVFAMAFIPPIGMRIGPAASIIGTILCLCAGGIGIWKIVAFHGNVNQAPPNSLAAAISASVQLGIGIYMVAACGLLTAFVIAAFPPGSNRRR